MSILTTTERNGTSTPRASIGDLVYRFRGQLGEMYPLGLFDDGIRFHNQFEGHVVDGPFAGARIFGLDQFMLRPDGVGVIVAPEVIDAGDVRVSLEVRGYLVPPVGAPVPPLEAVLQPGFEMPDAEFRVTGSATIATVAPRYAHLNRTTAVVEGTVNMGTGAMDVSAYSIDSSS
ncbi:MAG: hypothetical protein AB7L17_08875 [Ilumatobacteraceae bacterium]